MLGAGLDARRGVTDSLVIYFTDSLVIKETRRGRELSFSCFVV
jgi:hypothetical protein